MLLAACAKPPEHTVEAAPRPPFEPVQLQAVLVAGDASTRTFDDAVEYFADDLGATGIPAPALHRFSASPGRPPEFHAAVLANVLAATAALAPVSTGGCLVYVTSHGEADGSVTVGDGGRLSPDDLDHALSRGCSDAPTVVVISACRSGDFAAEPLTRANRIVITASRSDRDSFDCGAGAVFTFFDECLLSALPAAADWETVYERARGCVEVRERHVGVLPSEPQAEFGSAVRHLATPWRSGPDRPGMIVFAPGEAPYSAAEVPFRRAERQPFAAQFKAYGRARAPKAMAILPDGLAIWMNAETAGTRDPDDIARLVLERCELIAGGACVLYARDDRVTRLLPSGLAPFHPPLLMRGGRIGPGPYPFAPAMRQDAAAEYPAMASPKALAVSPARGAIGIGQGASLGAARTEALAQCGRDASDCIVYAEDDEIVLGWGG
jgi:hypothetical protein